MILTKKIKRNAKKEHPIKSGLDKKNQVMILGDWIKYQKIKSLNGK